MQKWEMYRLTLHHATAKEWFVGFTSVGRDEIKIDFEEFKKEEDAMDKFYKEVWRLLDEGWEPLEMDTNLGENRVLILKRSYTETT